MVPVVAAALEDIGGAGGGRYTVFFDRADDEAVTVDGDTKTKLICGVCVVGLEEGLLDPGIATALKDIGGTGIGAVLLGGADDEGVAIDGDAITKAVVCGGIVGLEIGLLHPVFSVALKDIDGTGVCHGVVLIVAAIAVFEGGADDHPVPIDGNAKTKAIVGVGIAGLDVGLLCELIDMLAGDVNGVGLFAAIFGSDDHRDEIAAHIQRQVDAAAGGQLGAVDAEPGLQVRGAGADLNRRH